MQVQAHLQENLWAANYEFKENELERLTAELDKIEIKGLRYTGDSAGRVTK